MNLQWLEAIDGFRGEAFAALLGRFWHEVIPGERPVPLSELHAQVAHGPAHRERGIGRWLKAQNALGLLGERPEVEHVETWNAAANDAMLSINRAMGFRVVARWQEWDLPCGSGEVHDRGDAG